MSYDDKQDKRLSEDEQAHNVLDVVESLDDVDENTPEAKLNETSIRDNNGGRIELDRSKMTKRPPVQGNFAPGTPFRKIDSDKD